jgi:hypothetical protein
MYLSDNTYKDYIRLFSKADLKQIDENDKDARQIYLANIDKGDDVVITKLKTLDAVADFQITHQDTDRGEFDE